VAGHDAVVNLATHMPPSTLRMLLPGAWRENDRIRRFASAILVDAAIAAAPRFVQESFGPGGRAAAVVSGAYSLSSNRASETQDYGGRGWVVSPEGEVLASTSPTEPFATVDIDLALAEQAKYTYPRYVLD